MTSVGVNVLRWSALAYGVGYGFTHQRTVYSADAARQEKQDYAKKEHRLEEAKQAWLNKVNPPKGDGVVSDPESPQFDLEKWINHQAKA